MSKVDLGASSAAKRVKVRVPRRSEARTPKAAEPKPAWLAKASAARPVETITGALSARNAWSDLAATVTARAAKGEARPASTPQEILTSFKDASAALQQLEKALPRAYGVLTGQFGSSLDATFGAPRPNMAQSVLEVGALLEKGSAADRAKLEEGLAGLIASGEGVARGLNEISITDPQLMTLALVEDLGLKGKLSDEQLQAIAQTVVDQNVKTAHAVETLSDKQDLVGIAEFMRAGVGEFIASTKTLLALKAALQKP